MPRRFAFSLVELVIVIVIIAIVAAIAVSRYGDRAANARATSTIAHIDSLMNVVLLYHAETGVWPEDKGAGILPPELADLLHPGAFSQETPVGGKYDWNNDWGPWSKNIGIHDNSPDLALWALVDEKRDDGNLNTGDVRLHNSRNLIFRIE